MEEPPQPSFKPNVHIAASVGYPASFSYRTPWYFYVWFVVCVSQYVSMCNRCTLLLFVRVDTEHMHVYRERESARAHTHTHTHKTDRGASRLLKGGIIAKNNALKHGQKATDVLLRQILSGGGVTDSAELGVVTNTLHRVLRQAKVSAT